MALEQTSNNFCVFVSTEFEQVDRQKQYFEIIIYFMTLEIFLNTNNKIKKKSYQFNIAACTTGKACRPYWVVLEYFLCETSTEEDICLQKSFIKFFRFQCNLTCGQSVWLRNWKNLKLIIKERYLKVKRCTHKSVFLFCIWS